MSFYERHVSETTMMTLVGIDAWTAPEVKLSILLLQANLSTLG